MKGYNPKNEEIYNGKIRNEIPIKTMDIILYDDNTNKIYEGEISEGVYKGYGIEYCPLVKDMVIYRGNFLNNYFIINNNFNGIPSNINTKKRLNPKILLLSKGDRPGKSLLISKITNTEYLDITTTSLNSFILENEYNENNYRISIYDSPTQERFLSISLNYVKNSDIIIYTIDLENNCLINDHFIDDILDRKNDIIIYVVGNKLDKIEEKDITKQWLEDIRNHASELIEQNKINKYFETSSLTGEGVDNLIRHLKIDSSIIYDKKLTKEYEKLISEGKLNKNDILIYKNKSNIKDIFKEREKIEKLNKIFKYYKY